MDKPFEILKDEKGFSYLKIIKEESKKEEVKKSKVTSKRK
jgi:hypothetical protein